jgi:hypothetical protein
MAKMSSTSSFVGGEGSLMRRSLALDGVVVLILSLAWLNRSMIRVLARTLDI